MQPVNPPAPRQSNLPPYHPETLVARIDAIQQLLTLRRRLTQEESDRCITDAYQTVVCLSAQPSLNAQMETVLKQALLVPIEIGFHHQDFDNSSSQGHNSRTTNIALIDGVYEMLALTRPLTKRESAQCLGTALWLEQDLFRPFLDPTMKSVLEKAIRVPFEIAFHHHKYGGPTQSLQMRSKSINGARDSSSKSH